MNANESSQPIDDLVARLVRTFDEQPLPPRPTNKETTSWISQNTNFDVPATSQSPSRRKAMRVMAPLAVLAASLVFVVAFWPASNNAFAQIVKQIANARTVKFSISIEQVNGLVLTGKAVAQRPELIRIDWTANGQKNVNVTNYHQGELVSYDESSDVKIHAIPDSGGFDVVRQLQKVDVRRTRNIPDSENSIPNTVLFEFEEGSLTGRLWTDEETGLPVRIEMRAPDELGGGQNIFSDFEWDVDVDASVFRIPTGRKIVRDNLLAAPTENELISAFRIRHAFSNEPYSDDFLSNDGGLTIGRLAYDHQLSRAENHVRQLKALGQVLTSIGLTQVEANDAKAFQERIDYLCMKADQWEHYVTNYGGWVGGGVNPGEEKPLCWWKLPAKGIRVLYADLTIRDAAVAP